MTRMLLALFLIAGPAFAETVPIRAADQARLDQQYRVRGEVIYDALVRGAPDDVDVLQDALSGVPIQGNPTGDWNCRTMKMGNLLPLVVYRNFRCRITDIGDGRYYLEKLTGSQRTRGIIRREGDYWVYLGVGYVGDKPAMNYSKFPQAQEPVDPGQTVPAIGEFIQNGPNKARIEFPLPLLESRYDILYLTR